MQFIPPHSPFTYFQNKYPIMNYSAERKSEGNFALEDFFFLATTHSEFSGIILCDVTILPDSAMVRFCFFFSSLVAFQLENSKKKKTSSRLN